MVGRRRFALLIIPILAAAGEARAQSWEGARLIGLGDSQRALTTGNDSIYINPGGLALGNMYSIELGYLDDFRSADRRFNASIVDSQAGPVAGGIAYSYSDRRPDQATATEERLSGHRFDIALATKVAENAALGVTARYLSYDRALDGQELPDQGFSAFTVDAGLQWRVLEFLSLGAAGYNLTNSDNPELPIGWGAGAGIELGSFTVEGDVRYNAQIGKPRFSLGSGIVLGETVALRAGGAYDRTTDSWIASGGVGLVFDRFNLDLAYRQRLNPEGEAEDRDERVFAAAIRITVF